VADAAAVVARRGVIAGLMLLYVARLRPRVAPATHRGKGVRLTRVSSSCQYRVPDVAAGIVLACLVMKASAFILVQGAPPGHLHLRVSHRASIGAVHDQQAARRWTVRLAEPFEQRGDPAPGCRAWPRLASRPPRLLSSNHHSNRAIDRVTVEGVPELVPDYERTAFSSSISSPSPGSARSRLLQPVGHPVDRGVCLH